jgi:hypothetical protein
MKTNCMAGHASRSSKGGTTRSCRMRMISKTNATQTANENIPNRVSDLSIADGAQMNELHVNIRGSALLGREALGSQIAVVRAEIKAQEFETVNSHKKR